MTTVITSTLTTISSALATISPFTTTVPSTFVPKASVAPTVSKAFFESAVAGSVSSKTVCLVAGGLGAYPNLRNWVPCLPRLPTWTPLMKPPLTLFPSRHLYRSGALGPATLYRIYDPHNPRLSTYCQMVQAQLHPSSFAMGCFLRLRLSPWPGPLGCTLSFHLSLHPRPFLSWIAPFASTFGWQSLFRRRFPTTFCTVS
ncbi:hypothetical protein C8J56DRAFT_1156566 [Mycena floridula]|nr:hypothetical protein C8J56DRAFT_1156566 [Mycena floridula]